MAEKQNGIAAAVAIAVFILILWFLLGQKSPSNGVTTVTESSAPIEIAGLGASAIPGLNLPPLSYVPPNVNYVGGSKGCFLCYNGYQRIETPAVAPTFNPPPAVQIHNHIMQNPLMNLGRLSIGVRA